jgi:predicted DNA-binding protein (MmcQ/YjbR family)
MVKARSIPSAVRELCLAFPQVEEFESHGSPNYRARKGKVFAVWALNHHGDGHVALWLNTPAMEQSRLLASSRHLYKPPYVGPSGWIAVELNRGVSWKRVCELAHMAYVNSSPAKLVAEIPRPPAPPAPTAKMKPAEIDRMLAPRAQKALAAMRRLCSGLPEVEEGTQMGSVVWRAGKRSFAMVYDYGKGLAAQFWVGIERQGPLEMDPRYSIPAYLGHKGWIALDLREDLDPRELRGLAIESYRHFASRRALAALDARERVA